MLRGVWQSAGCHLELNTHLPSPSSVLPPFPTLASQRPNSGLFNRSSPPREARTGELLASPTAHPLSDLDYQRRLQAPLHGESSSACLRCRPALVTCLCLLTGTTLLQPGDGAYPIHLGVPVAPQPRSRHAHMFVNITRLHGVLLQGKPEV